MSQMNNIASFCAGYISALCLTTPDWSDWGIPLSIECCTIDMIREGDKVNVIVFHPSGKREEFYMTERPNMYGDNEWVKA